MNIAVKAEETVDTVGRASQRAMQETGGDIAAASKLLAQWVRKDKALKAALLDPLIEYACNNAVRRVVIVDRDRVWNPPPMRDGLTPEQKIQIQAKISLMLFPLPGGKYLRDATRTDLAEASEFYRKQADDMSHKSRWLDLVAQSLPSGKSVNQVLTEDRLRDLQQEAANG